MVSTFILQLQDAGFSTAALFQVFYQVNVKLPHVEARNVLPVQVHHVAVGNAPLFFRLQQGELRAPSGGFHGHQSIVLAVEVLDNGIGDIQRKLAVLRLFAPGHDALVHHAGHVRCIFISGQTSALRQVRHRCQEVGILVPQTFQCSIIGGSDLLSGGLRDLVQQIFRVDAAPLGGVLMVVSVAT